MNRKSFAIFAALALMTSAASAASLGEQAFDIASTDFEVEAVFAPASTPESVSFDLVVMGTTGALGKHTATIAGPGRTGALPLEGADCNAIAVALIAAGSDAVCVPSGMGQAIHDDN